MAMSGLNGNGGLVEPRSRILRSRLSCRRRLVWLRAPRLVCPYSSRRSSRPVSFGRSILRGRRASRPRPSRERTSRPRSALVPRTSRELAASRDAREPVPLWRAHGASEAAARAAPASARSAWRAGRARRAGPGRAVGRGAARTLAATTRRHVALGPLPLGARLPLAGPSLFCQRVAPPWGRPHVMSLVVPLSHPERPGASATGCNGTTSSEPNGRDLRSRAVSKAYIRS